jgi:peptidoglycan hydrolase-like protein with peptidoglycan-binding domain
VHNDDAVPAAAVTTTDLAEPERWLASRSRARARRFAAARAATRRRLSGRSLALVAALMVLAAGGATAAERSTSGAAAPASPSLLQRGSTGTGVSALQSALGIPADGVFGPQTARAVRAYQRAHGLEVDGVAGPATLGALGVTVAAPPKLTATIGTQPGTVLARIARCESGGNPAAVSPDGRYRGKYQFTRATWRALGGSGDPAKAPEAEQDRLAALLLSREGTKPWPVCASRR